MSPLSLAPPTSTSHLHQYLLFSAMPVTLPILVGVQWELVLVVTCMSPGTVSWANFPGLSGHP